ncbi:hypothetical protein MTO96_024217 [Rhipicephalus appendiculatus]
MGRRANDSLRHGENTVLRDCNSLLGDLPTCNFDRSERCVLLRHSGHRLCVDLFEQRQANQGLSRRGSNDERRSLAFRQARKSSMR